MLRVITTVSTSVCKSNFWDSSSVKETVALAIQEGQDLHNSPSSPQYIIFLSKTFSILPSQIYRLSTSPSHATSYFQKTQIPRVSTSVI